MKANAYKLLGSATRYLAFVCTCLFLIGGGVWAKSAVDRFSAIQEEIEKDLRCPSPIFLERNFQLHQKTSPMLKRPTQPGPETKRTIKTPVAGI
jgi:hypothetical protein